MSGSCGTTINLDLTWWAIAAFAADILSYVGFYWLGKRRGYQRAMREVGGT